MPEGAHPQPGQRGLRRPEEPDVHPEDGDGGDHHDEGAGQHQAGDQGQVGFAPGQPAVDDLLDGDRHDHAAGGRDQGEREGDRQPPAELRHHPQAAAEGGEGALLAVVGRDDGVGHAATSACE